MVEDPDSFFGIPADSEVINEQQLNTGIVPDLLAVLVQIFLSVKNNQLVQQIAIVYKLAAVVAPACFHTTRREKIGLARTGDAVDPHILPVFSEVEFQDLLNRGIIIDAPVAGFQIFGLCAFIDQAAEPQIGFKSRIKGRYVFVAPRPREGTVKRYSRRIQGFQTALRSAGRLPARIMCPTSHKYIGSLSFHSRSPFPDASAGSVNGTDETSITYL